MSSNETSKETKSNDQELTQSDAICRPLKPRGKEVYMYSLTTVKCTVNRINGSFPNKVVIRLYLQDR